MLLTLLLHPSTPMFPLPSSLSRRVRKHPLPILKNCQFLNQLILQTHSYNQVAHVTRQKVHIKLNLIYILGDNALHVVLSTQMVVRFLVDGDALHCLVVLRQPAGEDEVVDVDHLVVFFVVAEV